MELRTEGVTLEPTSIREIETFVNVLKCISLNAMLSFAFTNLCFKSEVNVLDDLARSKLEVVYLLQML